MSSHRRNPLAHEPMPPAHTWPGCRQRSVLISSPAAASSSALPPAGRGFCWLPYSAGAALAAVAAILLLPANGKAALCPQVNQRGLHRQDTSRGGPGRGVNSNGGFFISAGQAPAPRQRPPKQYTDSHHLLLPPGAALSLLGEHSGRRHRRRPRADQELLRPRSFTSADDPLDFQMFVNDRATSAMDGSARSSTRRAGPTTEGTFNTSNSSTRVDSPSPSSRAAILPGSAGTWWRAYLGVDNPGQRQDGYELLLQRSGRRGPGETLPPRFADVNNPLRAQRRRGRPGLRPRASTSPPLRPAGRARALLSWRSSERRKPNSLIGSPIRYPRSPGKPCGDARGDHIWLARKVPARKEGLDSGPTGLEFSNTEHLQGFGAGQFRWGAILSLPWPEHSRRLPRTAARRNLP